MSAVAGPYWVRTATNGKHHVCGRHGDTVRVYPADSIAMATADCKRLQAGYTAAEKRIRDAAPELVNAAQDAIEILDVAIDLWNSSYPDEPDEVFTDLQDRFCAALSKALGTDRAVRGMWL